MLRDLPQTLPSEIKDMGKDQLLWFLAENSKDSKAPRNCEEVFADILRRYLGSPQPAKTWAFLVEGNRNLSEACYRVNTWRLATTAISVSFDIHKSWVAQAGVLAKVSSNPSSKVWFCQPPRLGCD